MTIDLCASLVKNEIVYEELLTSQNYGSKQELDERLDKFKELGVLVITDAPNNIINLKENFSEDEGLDNNEEVSVVAVEAQEDTKKSGGFYSKMRAFLKMGN